MSELKEEEQALTKKLNKQSEEDWASLKNETK
jgi:hypothetical protein